MRSRGILISESSGVLKDLMGNGGGDIHFESPGIYTYVRTNERTNKRVNGRVGEPKESERGYEKSYDCNKTRASELEVDKRSADR